MARMNTAKRERLNALKAINYTNRMKGRKVRLDPETKKPMVDAKGNTVYVKPRKHWCLYGVQAPDHRPLSDTGAEYILHVAPIMTYTALKGAWTKSGNPYLYRIMCNAPDAIRRGRGREWLEDTIFRPDPECGEKILVTMVPRRVKRTIAGVRVMDSKKTLFLTPPARKRNCTIADKHAPIYNVSLAFDDLVSVAILTLMDMVDRGIIANFEDVWNVRRFVYQAVNRAIHAERRIDNQTRENSVWLEDKRLDLIAKKAGKRPGFTARELWDSAVDLVDMFGGDNIDKRILYARGAGFTQAEIGLIVGLKQRTISKRLDKFRQRAMAGGLNRNLTEVRKRATERRKD